MSKSIGGQRGIMVTAFILAGSGWLGLYLILSYSLPTVGPRWLFFFLLTLAASGTGLPFVWLLHRRFGPEQLAASQILLRQGLMVGFWASLCMWLQINRTLTLPLALMLAGGLAIFEFLFRLLERSNRRTRR